MSVNVAPCSLCGGSMSVDLVDDDLILSDGVHVRISGVDHLCWPCFEARMKQWFKLFDRALAATFRAEDNG